LARLGERTVFRERQQGARRGLTARDDDLPERFFREPGSSGDGIDVPPLRREDFLVARGKYYRLRGLTPDGLPDSARARELDLP
jgi:aldehyde:ferredoxin oxidoreductase